MADLSRVDHDDLLQPILQFAGAEASANLGLASRKYSGLVFAPANDSLWKHFALARWGAAVVTAGVLEADGSDNDDATDAATTFSNWYKYFRRRCSVRWKMPPVPSQLDLIQERYASDPWKLLTSCILCSRTSGGSTVRTAVHDFLRKYPTPTHVIGADAKVMAKELHPLGLNRERTMKRFAADFVGPSWTHVTELHGCGAFAASSHSLFCLGDWKAVLRDKEADRNVRAYASHCQRYDAVTKGSKEEGAIFAEELLRIEEAVQQREKAGRKKRKRKPPEKRRSPLPAKRGKVPATGTRRSPRNK
jgi:hypothetical protein